MANSMRFSRIMLCTAGLLIVLAAVPGAYAAPCCSITGIDQKTGIVTARETATGRVFTFTVTNAKMRGSLRVGQGVYANFAKMQVSLDGIVTCCAISSLQPQGKTLNAGSVAPPPGVPRDLPCCSITQVSGNLYTAKSSAGTYFVFTPNPAPAGLTSNRQLAVGQTLYANFTTKQVSLDAASPIGTIKYLCTPPPDQPCPASASACQTASLTTPGCASVTYKTSIPAQCKSGYYGAHCDACAPTCVAPNGVCHDLITGDGTCACNQPFRGNACQYSDATTCSGHGIVDNTGGCTCQAGYSGANCSTAN